MKWQKRLKRMPALFVVVLQFQAAAVGNCLMSTTILSDFIDKSVQKRRNNAWLANLHSKFLNFFKKLFFLKKPIEEFQKIYLATVRPVKILCSSCSSRAQGNFPSISKTSFATKWTVFDERKLCVWCERVQWICIQSIPMIWSATLLAAWWANRRLFVLYSDKRPFSEFKIWSRRTFRMHSIGSARRRRDDVC